MYQFLVIFNFFKIHFYLLLMKNILSYTNSNYIYALKLIANNISSNYNYDHPIRTAILNDILEILMVCLPEKEAIRVSRRRTCIPENHSITRISRAIRIKKLSPRFISPFQVLKRIRSIAYHLICPIFTMFFHISQLWK